MSQLTVTVLQLGLLALLWLFVLSVVGVLRRDLYGSVVRRAATGGGAAGGTGRARRGGEPPPTTPPTTPPTPAAAVGAPPPPAAPPAPRHLAVTEGPLTGTVLELGRSPVLIGRAPECTLVLADDYASSRHARLVPQEGQWVLEDLGSTNGTTLARSGRSAAEPVRGSTRVGVGATIRIGRTTLELQR
jgi:hypothetical protein